MQVFTTLALFLPALAAGGLLRRHAHAGDAAIGSSTMRASPASSPTLGSTAATSRAGYDVLELRQAPALAPINAVPANPAVSVPAPVNPSIPQLHPAAPPALVPANPIIPPAVAVPPAHPISPAVPPAVPTAISAPPAITSMRLASPGVTGEFVTTQWVETWIGGTSQTWVPQTITIRFKPMTQAPLPGKGEIGMGTLTGETGITKTIVIGAAPSQVASWAGGVAAAVGVGIAGMII